MGISLTDVHRPLIPTLVRGIAPVMFPGPVVSHSRTQNHFYSNFPLVPALADLTSSTGRNSELMRGAKTVLMEIDQGARVHD
jgi:hypothetical protein